MIKRRKRLTNVEKVKENKVTKKKYFLIPTKYSKTIIFYTVRSGRELMEEIEKVINKNWGRTPILFDFEVYTGPSTPQSWKIVLIISAQKNQVPQKKKAYPVDYFYLKALSNLAKVPSLVVLKIPNEEKYIMAIVGFGRIYKISEMYSSPPDYTTVRAFYEQTVSSFSTLDIGTIVKVGDFQADYSSAQEFYVDEVEDYNWIERAFRTKLNLMHGGTKKIGGGLSQEEISEILVSLKSGLSKIILLLFIYAFVNAGINVASNYNSLLLKNIEQVRRTKEKYGLEERVKKLKQATDSLKEWIEIVKENINKGNDWIKLLRDLNKQKLVEISSITFSGNTLNISCKTPNYKNAIEFTKTVAMNPLVVSVSPPPLKNGSFSFQITVEVKR